MKRCIIVGAGSIYDGDLPFTTKEDDLIIAADGGYWALQQAGMIPHLLIGDFDSMERPEVTCETLTLPVEKDDTDLVYAVKEGFARGYKTFVLYGGLGGKRLSHTLANLQLLAYIKEQGGDGVLLGGGTQVYFLKEETREISATPQSHCSVLSFSGQASVSSRGLYYPMDQTVLTDRFPLGVSNHFVTKTATLTVHQGSVVVIVEKSI